MAAKWYAANQHRNKTYKARYRAKNREKVRLANADWYSRNKERRNLVIRAWQKANPDAVRVIMENRRARIKATGRLSKGIVKKLIKLQRGKCACCGESLGTNYHLDHITPLALGGSNTDDNVQLLRARCNREKNAKHPVDFMRQRGFLC